MTVTHGIAPVWNAESRILILGTMPSPKSREAGFFYMHPQNRFWKIMPALFGEQFSVGNGSPDKEKAIAERRNFLLRHKIALWDVLKECEISGASDSSIKNAVPNDFSEIFGNAKIERVFCTGKTSFALWKKHCARYETRYKVGSACLPSTSPANARFTESALVEAYREILGFVEGEMNLFESGGF